MTSARRPSFPLWLLSGLLALSSALPLGAQAPADAKAAATNSSEAPAEKVRTLGILLFPGFETLDACGPIQMWGSLRARVKVVLVAREKGPIESKQGPKMLADHDFTDCPPLDLILVPGGFGAVTALRNAATLEWLRSHSAKAEITMSVCNGASILAAAGLLDGRSATTNKAYWALATKPGPKVKWVTEARWVDDGNIVTSSGVSAGMDMSLHVISRLYGGKIAERLANEAEYDWHRDPAWDPFAKLHGLSGGK